MTELSKNEKRNIHTSPAKRVKGGALAEMRDQLQTWVCLCLPDCTRGTHHCPTLPVRVSTIHSPTKPTQKLLPLWAGFNCLSQNIPPERKRASVHSGWNHVNTQYSKNKITVIWIRKENRYENQGVVGEKKHFLHSSSHQHRGQSHDLS